MFRPRAILVSILSGIVLTGSARCAGQSAVPVTPQAAPQERVIIDTDIGDDIDDAFAVALALRSPELQILGITTTFGDTETRAKLLDRLLGKAGRADIPVAVGARTPPKTAFTQLRYAESGRYAKPSHPDAVAFLLEQIRLHPGEITLICIEQGYTRVVAPPKALNGLGPPGGARAQNPANASYVPNAQVCLESNADAFFQFLLPRLATP